MVCLKKRKRLILTVLILIQSICTAILVAKELKIVLQLSGQCILKKTFYKEMTGRSEGEEFWRRWVTVLYLVSEGHKTPKVSRHVKPNLLKFMAQYQRI